jgi:tetratricopeptide (TPR) repeat protein
MRRFTAWLEAKPWQNPAWWAALPRTELFQVSLLFGLAFGLRLIYILQYMSSPDFNNPIGDSMLYYERAQEMLAGDWLGRHIPFHSSPLYPAFLAIFLWLFSFDFLMLRVVQVLLGAANCVAIYYLTKELARGHRPTAMLAGLMAALYGTLAFFDGDLLMIFLTLLALDLALLFLIRARAAAHWGWPLAAGACFGLAGLDKVNLLLFVPIGALYVAGAFREPWKAWRWPQAGFFILGVTLMVAPVTLNNYRLERDWVPVSSNAGVNLFIGNNPKAQGMFQLPYASGLSNLDLHGSSVEYAEKNTGRKLKPSQVSAYWAGQAWEFIRRHPAEAVKLYWRKFNLIFNHYEVPNHLNFYFTKRMFAPALALFVFGFGIVFPLALVGLYQRWRQGASETDILLGAFLLVYFFSLMPFFITERYRLPMVPVYIAYAACALWQLGSWLAKRELSRPFWISLAILGFALWRVNQPPHVMISYSHNRVAIAGKYMERALRYKETGSQDMLLAIVQLKLALENEPLSEDANYNLGRAYEAVGFYSGAVQHLQKTIEINPRREAAIQPIVKAVQEKGVKSGDMLKPENLPQTPFEHARGLEAQGRLEEAIAEYEKIFKEDPFHLQALTQIGFIYFRQQRFADAARVFKRGLKSSPENFALLNNLAGAYVKSGKRELGIYYYRRCLKIEPKSELILRQLRMIGAAPEGA